MIIGIDLGTTNTGASYVEDGRAKAAMAYGHKQMKKARVAVWDFGGGTGDFSVVDLSEGQLEVLATGGDNFVGGSDFDDRIASARGIPERGGHRARSRSAADRTPH